MKYKCESIMAIRIERLNLTFLVFTESKWHSNSLNGQKLVRMT